METTQLLAALAELQRDLKSFTTQEVDRLYKSQDVRFEQIEGHLRSLNGKVADHERRFIEQDGAEKLRRRQQERAAAARLANAVDNDSDEMPADFATAAQPASRKKGAAMAAAQRGFISANLSVRDVLWLLLLFAAIATGKWDWISTVIMGGAK